MPVPEIGQPPFPAVCMFSGQDRPPPFPEVSGKRTLVEKEQGFLRPRFRGTEPSEDSENGGRKPMRIFGRKRKETYPGSKDTVFSYYRADTYGTFPGGRTELFTAEFPAAACGSAFFPYRKGAELLGVREFAAGDAGIPHCVFGENPGDPVFSVYMTAEGTREETRSAALSLLSDAAAEASKDAVARVTAAGAAAAVLRENTEGTVTVSGYGDREILKWGDTIYESGK